MNVRRIRLPLLAAVATLALAAGSHFAAAAPKPTLPPVTYMIHWLPVGTNIIDLNNDADFVGDFNDGATVAPFVNLQGVSYSVNALVNDPAWEIVTASALSNRHNGVVYVVGYGYRDGVKRRRAYRLALTVSAGGAPAVGEFRNLETLPDDIHSQATSINALGQVVGVSWGTGEDPEPFFYSDSEGMVSITNQRLGWNDTPFIAESGHVGFGFVDAASGNKLVAVWDTVTDQFTTTSLGSYGSLYGINNLGNFCGNTTDRTGFKRIGYAYINGRFKDLSATMTDANSINAANNVVGQNTKYQYLYLYFDALNKTYRVDQLFAKANSSADVDLWNSSVSPYPTRLNDAGVIAGSCVPGTANVRQSFLLFPVTP